MYKIINLEQGSEDWHTFRSNHIGGSDAPIIMGLSPWSKETKLWALKMGFSDPIVMTDRMKRGHDLEPVVREWYINKTGTDFTPIVIKSNIHPFMSASLDGISNVKPLYMIEIKCPNEDTHELACAGVIKNYYMCQIQHCLFVGGFEKCTYISYRPESKQQYAVVHIDRNEQQIEKIIEKEKNFWKCMVNMIEPEGDWVLKIKKTEI